MRPNLQIFIKRRNNETTDLRLRDFSIIKHDDLQFGHYIVLYKDIFDIGVYVFITQFNNNEFDIRVAFINAFPNVGPFYFKQIRITLNNQVVFNTTGRHVIPTRLALCRRFSVSTSVLEYAHLESFLPSRPLWLRNKFNNTISSDRRIFGPYETWGHPSPYTHGGNRISPYHAGWWGCKEGLVHAQKWLNGTVDRMRIWSIDRNTGFPTPIPREYNLLRGIDSELPEFNYTGDSWCRYENIWTTIYYNGGVNSHDGPHLRRAFSEALLLKNCDPWADFYLDALYNDVKMAWTMDESVTPISRNWHPNEQTLWWRLKNTPIGQGAMWANRELAQVMILASRLGKDRSLWQNVIMHVANTNGLMQSVGPDSYFFPDARIDPPGMTGYISQSFESMLLLQACREQGVDAVANQAAISLGTHPKYYIDVNTLQQANSQAIIAQYGPNYFVPFYSAFTHNDLSEFIVNPNLSLDENLLQQTQQNSLEGSPLDNIDPTFVEGLF